MVKTASLNWNRKLENLRNNISNNTMNTKPLLNPKQLCPFSSEIFNLRKQVDKLELGQSNILETIRDKSDDEQSCQIVDESPPFFGDFKTFRWRYRQTPSLVTYAIPPLHVCV